MSGPEIAECLAMALSTVSGILTRIGWASSVGSACNPLSATSELVLAICGTSMSGSSDGSNASGPRSRGSGVWRPR